MSKIITRYTTFLGFASWLVPFIVSFLFVDRAGQFLIPRELFKSLMVVLFGGLGTALLVAAFQRIRLSIRSGAVLGSYWLAINLAMDILILVPLLKIPVSTYFFDIGLRYLLIPIIAIALGFVADAVRAKPGLTRQ